MKVYVSYHSIGFEETDAYCKEFDNREDAARFVEGMRGPSEELISIVEGVRLMMPDPELIEMPSEMSGTKDN